MSDRGIQGGPEPRRTGRAAASESPRGDDRFDERHGRQRPSDLFSHQSQFHEAGTVAAVGLGYAHPQGAEVDELGPQPLVEAERLRFADALARALPGEQRREGVSERPLLVRQREVRPPEDHAVVSPGLFSFRMRQSSSWFWNELAISSRLPRPAGRRS